MSGRIVPLAQGLGIDDPVRMQARIQEPGREQIPAAEAPEDRSLETGRDSGREKGCAAGEFGGGPRLDHLVQRASGQAASGQMAIDRA